MNYKMRNFIVRTACAFVAVFVAFTGVAGLPQLALAQEATLEEVIVTAQRREERLQDVPLAITVLSGAELERRQVQNVLDLQSSVPNISISQNTGTSRGARIALRGVSEDDSRAPVDPAIALYLDGVYIGRQTGGLIDLFDVEQIEVLRGPQGTLYGRNSNGGAIRITTRKPTYDESFAAFKSIMGNYDRFDTVLSTNLSNSSDFAMSFALLTSKRDGLFRTTADPARGIAGGERVGKLDNFAGRVGLRWQTGEATDILLRLDATEDDTEPRPPNLIETGNYGILATGFVPTRFVLEDEFRLVPPFDANTHPHTAEIKNRGVSLTVEHDLGGGLHLQSLTAHRRLEEKAQFALFTHFGFSRDRQDTDQTQFSQEFQVSSDWDGGLNFVAGLFWFSEDVDILDKGDKSLDTDVQSVALFGQGRWDIIRDQLWVTAGLRYTDESKDFKGVDIANPDRLVRDDTEDESSLSYKAAVNYQLRDNVMVYGSYATGFRSAGWYASTSRVPSLHFRAVDKETVETAEVGLRSDWMDNRLRVNATYFFSTYEDLQLNGTIDLGFTRFNVPEAEISGLELEVGATPIPGLNISLAAAWMDTEYTDVDLSAAAALSGVGDDYPGLIESETQALLVNQVLTDNTDIPRTATYSFVETNYEAQLNMATTALGGLSDVQASAKTRVDARLIDAGEDKKLKNAPEASVKLSVSYTYPLADNLELQINGTFAWEDEHFTVAANGVKREETELLDLRVGLRSDRWEVSLWGKNLTDELYHAAGVHETAVYWADPRTYGLDFKLRFE